MAFRIFRKLGSWIRIPVVTTTLRWTVRVVPVLVVMDIGYLIGIWPDWELYSEGPIQRSSFIRSYEFEQHRHSDWPRLRFRKVEDNPERARRESLRWALYDPSPRVRLAAVRGLSRWLSQGGERMRQELALSASKDPSPAVRTAAKRAMGQ